MKIFFRVLTCLSLLVPAVMTMVADKTKPAVQMAAVQNDPKTTTQRGVENAVEIITILENPQ